MSLNVNVLSIAKRKAGMVWGPITLLTRPEIKAILKKEKASPSSVYEKLMRLYSLWKSHEAISLQVQSAKVLEAWLSNKRFKRTRSALSWLNGPFCSQCHTMPQEFSKSSTYRVYTWYINLKPGSTHNFEHLVSLFNTNSCCAEAKFSLVKLSQVTPKGRTGCTRERILW